MPLVHGHSGLFMHNRKTSQRWLIRAQRRNYRNWGRSPTRKRQRYQKTSAHQSLSQKRSRQQKRLPPCPLLHSLVIFFDFVRIPKDADSNAVDALGTRCQTVPPIPRPSQSRNTQFHKLSISPFFFHLLPTVRACVCSFRQTPWFAKTWAWTSRKRSMNALKMCEATTALCFSHGKNTYLHKCTQ